MDYPSPSIMGLHDDIWRIANSEYKKAYEEEYMHKQTLLQMRETKRWAGKHFEHTPSITPRPHLYGTCEFCATCKED
jgi:hypothetical protein